MKGALTKRLDSVGADLRTLMRDKNLRHSGINREGERLVIRFPRRRDPGQGPDCRCSTPRPTWPWPTR